MAFPTGILLGEDILAAAERWKRLPRPARRALEWLGHRRLLWERV